MSIRGVTFDNQQVTASDHGTLFKEIFPTDGILIGCEITASGSNISIAAGYMVVAGRLFQNTASYTLTAAASGNYVRVLAVIDTSQTATTSEFAQVSFTLDYSATLSGFPALTQDDINAGSGNTYQAALAIYALSGSTVGAIASGPNYASVSAQYATSAGNAATAKALASARNFTIADNDGSNTGPATAFKGIAAALLKLPATIKASFVGNVTGNVSGSSGSCTGNAATASKLATARNISIASSDGTGAGSAVAFDGSGNATLKLPATIKASLSGNASTATTASACSGNAATATTASACSGNAATATKLATARTISLTDADGTNTGTAVTFDGSANKTLKLPATIKASLSGNATTASACSGNAATATKLATARTIRTNLASTSTASFDGSGNVTPGVQGTLGEANGGTGQQTLSAALDAMCTSRVEVTGTPNDDTTYICQDSQGNDTFWRRKHSSLYNYIKGKLDSVVWDASNIPNLSAAKITSGTLPIWRGGTGATTADAALTSLGAASASHTHDTYAPKASPALSGTPTAPTAAAGTNTTQIATTAFVTTALNNKTVPSASSTTPKMDGTAAVGTGTTWARGDHVHPTDTSRAAASHTHNASDITGANTSLNSFSGRRIYISTSAPTPSQGSIGDIWIQY